VHLCVCVCVCGMMTAQLEDMSTENSTANSTWSNTTKATPDYTTKTAAFFDPVWQIAIMIEFYFRYVVLALGIFGMAANALVLYALITHNAQQAKKRVINLLIIHQNLIDLSCCVLLVITYATGDTIYLTGALGYFLCTIFISDLAIYCALNASVINLVTLTIERYLKIVHPFWSKKNLKHWMIHAAMVFAWIAGMAFNVPTVFTTTVVYDGTCFPYFIWESPTAWRISGAIYIVVLLILPLIVFIYCYGCIVVVMRRQMRVMAGHNVEGSSQMNASQIQSKRLKWNIIKTMITVSVVFVICWAPSNIHYIVMDPNTMTSSETVGYFPTVFMVYLNICMNPFIYAMKHEGVKEKLASLMCKCQKKAVTDDPRGSSNNAGRTQQTPAGVIRP